MITTTGVTYITPEYATHQRMYTETDMFGKVREVSCSIPVYPQSKEDVLTLIKLFTNK